MKYLYGKLHAAKSLIQFMRWFENWSEVWAAYRTDQTLPTLRLRGGMVLDHGVRSDAIVIFREVFAERCYTRPGFYTPRSTDYILDLGANVGITALFHSRIAPGIRIDCYEPIAETRGFLERNISQNNLSSSVKVYPEAVSGHDGTLKIFAGTHSGKSSVQQSEFTSDESFDLPCISLATALSRNPSREVDLLKVDVEGGEIEIFSSLEPATLSTVRRIAAEFHDMVRPGCLVAVQTAVENAGFNHIEVDYSLKDKQLGVLLAQKT